MDTKNKKTDEYFYHCNKYKSIYGLETVVFMEIGEFYELYQFEDQGSDLQAITTITNLVLTRQNKQKDLSSTNTLMMGFQSQGLEKYVKILVEHNYTVVVVSQVSPAPNPKRAVTGIYSPGININSTSNDSNNLVCIYVEDEKYQQNILPCIGLSSIDVNTGSCVTYEICSKVHDLQYAIDEAARFILTKSPKELIIAYDPKSTSDIIPMLNIDNIKIHKLTNVNKNFCKVTYQNEFLNKIYKNKGTETPIENIDMHMMTYARMSLIILLDFVHKQNESFITCINKPEIFQSNKHLILGGDAIQQLNITQNESLDTSNTKIRCLIDVIDHTQTALGKRFIKHAICNPLNDDDEITLRYNCIEELMNSNLTTYLQQIVDVEKLFRKITLALLHPYQLASLYNSCEHILIMFEHIKTLKYVLKLCPVDDVLVNIKKFIVKIKNTFVIDELKYGINDIETSFFKLGLYKKIDDLVVKVVDDGESMSLICKVLSDMLDGKGNKMVQKKNRKSGSYLQLTKKRADQLKDKLKDMTEIKITDALSIDVNKLEFVELTKGNTKIFFRGNNINSSNTNALNEELIHHVKNEYIKLLSQYNDEFINDFKEICKSIAKIDFVNSGAICAKMHGYCRPNIVESELNYVDAKRLRHPIGERLRNDVEYVPHDICIGKEYNMLLYGINSSGKSNLMKAIGLAVIMAQSGLFVAAEKFQFTLYSSLFARITGNDNIFKNLSSFSLEMTELNAILNRTGPKTMVIGDEICRGTEAISANSIVAATIIKLAKTGSTFIFATHLHEIAGMSRIKDLKNVKSFHLTIDYDKDKDILIFDRLLKEGPGSSIYGLTIAKYIIKDNDFIKLAQDIKNELIDEPNELLVTKRSKYNNNLFVDACQTCGKRNVNKDHVGVLDTHHISFQSNCDENGFVIGKSYVKMNDKSNLVILCKVCHHKVHHGGLVINGYSDTTDGAVLDFKFVRKTKT